MGFPKLPAVTKVIAAFGGLVLTLGAAAAMLLGVTVLVLFKVVAPHLMNFQAPQMRIGLGLIVVGLFLGAWAALAWISLSMVSVHYFLGRWLLLCSSLLGIAVCSAGIEVINVWLVTGVLYFAITAVLGIATKSRST